MKDLQQTVYLSALWYMFFNVHIIKRNAENTNLYLESVFPHLQY